RRDLFDQSKNFLHEIGATDDLSAIDGLAHGASQRASFFLFASSLNSSGDGGGDLFVLEWFANATESAPFPGGNGGIKSRVGGDHNDHGFRIHFQKLFKSAQSADARHRNVQEHYIESAASVCFQTF